MFRHKAGQLDSLKQLDFDELEKKRMEQAKKLRVLEEAYWKSREGTVQGKLMKQRLGFTKQETDAPSPPEGEEGDEYTFGKSKKQKKQMKSSEGWKSRDEDEFSGSRSRSKRGSRRPKTGKTKGSDDEYTFGLDREDQHGNSPLDKSRSRRGSKRPMTGKVRDSSNE